jgi:hypothetical protein
MWIMTTGAVHDHPFPPPAGQPFPVRAARPVAALLEVACVAELVRVIHAYGAVHAEFQRIRVFRVVAGRALHNAGVSVLKLDVEMHRPGFNRR